MSSEQALLHRLRAGWKLCTAQDDQKHRLISELFAYIDNLSSKLSEAESELSDKKDVIKLARDRVREGETQIAELQREKARLGFASVVIDGDCMPFRDELVTQGLDGGKRAANLLKQAVEEELKSSVPTAAHHLQVIIRVYANVKGLANTYKEMDVVSEPTLDQFVRGFNMGDAMCDYIDAGNGKECSDEKVKALFKFYSSDVHCQQILFGGSADNGYARLLGPYAEDETVRGRVTLLQGPPFARELADIKDRFRTASFGNVFRCQKLANNKRRVSFHITPPTTPSLQYASVAAKAPSTPAPPSTPQAHPSRAPVPVQVLRNSGGQRVDPPISYLEEDFVKVKGRKLCNSFHLLGRCTFLDSYGKCMHDHKGTLTPGEKAALRAVARQSSCPRGLECADPNCLFGHCCPRSNCVLSKCWFPPAMHNIDTKIVG